MNFRTNLDQFHEVARFASKHNLFAIRVRDCRLDKEKQRERERERKRESARVVACRKARRSQSWYVER